MFTQFITFPQGIIASPGNLTQQGCNYHGCNTGPLAFSPAGGAGRATTYLRESRGVNCTFSTSGYILKHWKCVYMKRLTSHVSHFKHVVCPTIAARLAVLKGTSKQLSSCVLSYGPHCEVGLNVFWFPWRL